MFLANVIGYLGADAEVKTADGREFVTFRIAHTRKYKDAQGTIHESTQWIDCVISGRPNVTQYLHKGTQVYVSGSVELRIYDSAKDHCKKAGVQVRVQSIELLGSANKDSNQPASETNDGSYTQFTEVKDAPF